MSELILLFKKKIESDVRTTPCKRTYYKIKDYWAEKSELHEPNTGCQVQSYIWAQELLRIKFRALKCKILTDFFPGQYIYYTTYLE